MGGCCSTFGTYLVKKEESKSGHGSTPKLSKLEHKTSFIGGDKNSGGANEETNEPPQPLTNGIKDPAPSTSSSSSPSSTTKVVAEAPLDPHLTLLPEAGSPSQTVSVEKTVRLINNGGREVMQEVTTTTSHIVSSSSTVLTETFVVDADGQVVKHESLKSVSPMPPDPETFKAVIAKSIDLSEVKPSEMGKVTIHMESNSKPASDEQKEEVVKIVENVVNGDPHVQSYSTVTQVVQPHLDQDQQKPVTLTKMEIHVSETGFKTEVIDLQEDRSSSSSSSSSSDSESEEKATSQNVQQEAPDALPELKTSVNEVVIKNMEVSTEAGKTEASRIHAQVKVIEADDLDTKSSRSSSMSSSSSSSSPASSDAEDEEEDKTANAKSPSESHNQVSVVQSEP